MAKKNELFDRGIITADNPTLVNTVRDMIKNGYQTDTIQRITEAPREMIESHQLQLGHGKEGKKIDKAKRRYTDAEKQLMVERMAKARQARKQSGGKVVDAIKTSE